MFSCFCRSGLPTPTAADDLTEGLRNPSANDLDPSPAQRVIIGKVVFQTHRGELAEAILDREGRWCCPMLPVLDRVLNILYEPGRLTDGDLPDGHAELFQVAAWLKGHVCLPRS